LWLARYGFESLDDKVKYFRKKWIIQDIMGKNYALEKHE
jgi:hypothetical protein